MTGEKNRYKTLDKMWKLDDEQLKTPKHDEMVLYLLNKDLIRSILFKEIKNFSEKLKEFYLKRIENLRERLNNEIKEYDQGIKESKGQIKYYKKELENDNFNINLKQLIVTNEKHIQHFEEKITNTTEKANKNINVLLKESKLVNSLNENIPLNLISEAPIKASNGFLVGYWDLIIEIGDLSKVGFKNLRYFDMEKPAFYFEVKPRITSFGATLRQLRTYQSYLKDRERENIYLYTEDLRFKDAFESQGIKVISPPERQATF